MDGKQKSSKRNGDQEIDNTYESISFIEVGMFNSSMVLFNYPRSKTKMTSLFDLISTEL